ncbi:MAG: PaaI family thioesterase [Mycobacteriales bacterium]
MPSDRGYPLPPDAEAPARSEHTPPAGTSLGNHYDGCFACGSDHADGLHLTARAGEGLDVVSYVEVTGAHQGAPGLAHGGLVATVMDETLGFMLWMLGAPGVTAKLEVSYRKPVPIRRTVATRAECTGVAGRKVYGYAEMHQDDLDGPLLAEASGLFVIVGEEHFRPYLDNVAGEAPARLPGRPRYNP